MFKNHLPGYLLTVIAKIKSTKLTIWQVHHPSHEFHVIDSIFDPDSKYVTIKLPKQMAEKL